MNNEICPICKKRTAKIITKNDAVHSRFVHIVACSNCGKINEIVEPYKKSERKSKMIDCSKAVNFIKEKQRMTKRCKIHCAKCPLGMFNNGTDTKMTCDDLEKRYPEKAVEIVQKWSDEHPQRTYLTELLKNYPNVKIARNGMPMNMCPSRLGLKDLEDCDVKNCVECWNQPIGESENEQTV